MTLIQEMEVLRQLKRLDTVEAKILLEGILPGVWLRYRKAVAAFGNNPVKITEGGVEKNIHALRGVHLVLDEDKGKVEVQMSFVPSDLPEQPLPMEDWIGLGVGGDDAVAGDGDEAFLARVLFVTYSKTKAAMMDTTIAEVNCTDRRLWRLVVGAIFVHYSQLEDDMPEWLFRQF